MITKKIPAAVVTVIATAILAVVTGCGGGNVNPSSSHPGGTRTATGQALPAEHLPTAKEIAAKVGGTNFKAGYIGPVIPNKYFFDQTSTGKFWIGNKVYFVNTFATAKGLNGWMKEWVDPYGLVVKWKGETWVVTTIS